MRYLLDTNAWVDYFSRRFPGVAERIAAADPEDVVLSSVVLAELRYGADKSQHSRRNHARLDLLADQVPGLDFTSEAAAAFGRLRSSLEAQGTPIGPYDMFIAAQALAHGLVLVTDNLREFGRIEGLRLENWRARA